MRPDPASWPAFANATAGKPRRYQKLTRIAACMMRGSRAAVALPKLAFTCLPVAGSNCALVFNVDHCVWLKTLYISHRIWSFLVPPIAKFLNAEMFEFTIRGIR